MVMSIYFPERVMNEGVKAGWEVLDEILKVTTKYRVSVDLGVSFTQVTNWERRVHAPSLENFHRLVRYRAFAQERDRAEKRFSRFDR